MDNPTTNTSQPPCNSNRSSASNSPEFEFWRLCNPSLPQPTLLSADELFSGGVLLPLHRLHHNPETEPKPSTSDPDVPDPEPEPGPEISRPAEAATGSKRWKDIFKKSDKKIAAAAAEESKVKKREKKSQIGASSAAELNIHIWPFSRSRSAGNGGARPRMTSGGRKVSSAPCSRSNSAGESKSRKWPGSPSRAGVHLGRSSPVWQVRRAGSGRKNPNPEPKKEATEPRRSKAAAGGNDGGETKGRVLNLNVPMCIGYKNHFSCRSNENNAPHGRDGADSGGGGGNMGGGGGGLFNIRNLFTKKVY